MFVDSSAIVAILTREPEADTLADVLEKARSPITSPIAIFEAALGICRKRHASVEEAEQDVGEFLEVAGVRTAPITDEEAHTALAAFSRYGKGRGHPAQLNLGDCFAYAMAKNARRRCCSRARISTRPTSAPPRGRAKFRRRRLAAMRETSGLEAAGLSHSRHSDSRRPSRRSAAARTLRRSSCCCNSFRSMPDRRAT